MTDNDTCEWCGYACNVWRHKMIREGKERQLCQCADTIRDAECRNCPNRISWDATGKKAWSLPLRGSAL